MVTWKYNPINIHNGEFFVFIENGYITSGNRDSSQSERLSHFVDWDEIKSFDWLVKWAKDFLNGLPEMYEQLK